MLMLLACAASEVPVDDTAPAHPDLPEHSSCPGDEALTDEVCLAVVEEDGRYPTYSVNRSYNPDVEDDPRLEDPDYIWLEEQIRDCTCTCCHRTAFGGPGVYLWDLDYEPVWIDSMSSWSMRTFAGETDEAAQTLPVEDVERFLSVIEAERQYRRDH